MNLTRFGVHGTRKMQPIPAINYVAKDICRVCNNGWMNNVDKAVDSLIMSIARKERDLLSFNPGEVFSLSRWVFKTACANESTKEPEARGISKEVFRSAHIDTFLPDGFISFVTKVPPETMTEKIAASLVNVWFSPDHFLKADPSNSVKFGAQYKHVIIGCAWVTGGIPTFIGHHAIHIPLYIKNAFYESRLEIYDEPLPMVQNTFLNFTLVQLALAFRDYRPS